MIGKTILDGIGLTSITKEKNNEKDKNEISLKINSNEFTREFDSLISKK